MKNHLIWQPLVVYSLLSQSNIKFIVFAQISGSQREDLFNEIIASSTNNEILHVFEIIYKTYLI